MRGAECVCARQNMRCQERHSRDGMAELMGFPKTNKKKQGCFEQRNERDVSRRENMQSH